LGGEFAFEGVFEDGLAVDFELCASRLQALYALVQLRKQLLNLRYDAALFVEGGIGRTAWAISCFAKPFCADREIIFNGVCSTDVLSR